MRREFVVPDDAPTLVMVEDVFHPIERAWTARFEPLYVAQWWHPPDYVNHIVEMDLVPGGAWRIVQRDPDGHQLSVYGHIEQVEEHKVVQQTLVSELFPEFPTKLRTEFQVVGELTRIVTTHHLLTDEVRSGFLRLGAIERMAETSDNYAALLTELAKR